MVGFALHETSYRGSLHASGGALQCVRHHCRELTCYYCSVTLYCQGITLLRDFQLTGKVYNLASPSLVFNLAWEFVFSRVELLMFLINYLGILDASVPPWSRGTLAKQQAKKWISKWQNKAGRLKKQRRDYIIETHTIKQICQSSGGENEVVKREQSRGRMDKQSQNKTGKRTKQRGKSILQMWLVTHQHTHASHFTLHMIWKDKMAFKASIEWTNLFLVD